MARVCVLVCFAGLLLELCGVISEIAEENTGKTAAEQESAGLTGGRAQQSSDKI